MPARFQLDAGQQRSYSHNVCMHMQRGSPTELALGFLEGVDPLAASSDYASCVMHVWHLGEIPEACFMHRDTDQLDMDLKLHGYRTRYINNPRPR